MEKELAAVAQLWWQDAGRAGGGDGTSRLGFSGQWQQ
jgi:hypothetical protein